MSSHSVVLYRFRISLSDVERSVYEELDFRMAMHPSESFPFLLSRMFAYILNYQEGLAFSAAGLSEPDEPCISSPDPMGGFSLWVEVGSPSARRIHKATKSARKVRVYTYKNPQALLGEIKADEIYNIEKLEIFSLTPDFLEALEQVLVRDNAWSVIYNDGTLTVNIADETIVGQVSAHAVQ